MERAYANFPSGGPGRLVGTEFEDGAVVFFGLHDRLKLALYPRWALAREQVDEVMEQARVAGAMVLDPARDRFWGGYSGYFQDPDGHPWEIAWNPAWEVD